MEAFELAIRQGADGIELDVHTSADGELIVMHDENCRPRHRRNRTDQRYDTGSIERIKSQYTRRTIGNLSHVPTLAEVLELMRTTDMMVNIELKNSICFYPGMEGKDPETGKGDENGRPVDLFLL